MKPYYYVYTVGGNVPTYKHDTLESARKEAERLAAGNKGRSFEILKCVGISSVPKPIASTFWMDGESIPSKWQNAF